MVGAHPVRELFFHVIEEHRAQGALLQKIKPQWFDDSGAATIVAIRIDEEKFGCVARWRSGEQ